MHKIALIPGDGTGPEVTREAEKVLDAAAAACGFKVDKTEFDFGGDRYLRTGEVLPDSAVDDLRQFDGILLGAIGHPDVKPGILEKGILLHLRFALDLYINLRPVKLYPGVETPLKDKGPEHIDFTVRAREHRGSLRGRRRLSQEGHRRRDRGAGVGQHPQRRSSAACAMLSTIPVSATARRP